LHSDATDRSGAAPATELTEAMLLGSVWHYGHDGQPPSSTTFRLLPGGGIDG
jgi:hypothetical protein